MARIGAPERLGFVFIVPNPHLLSNPPSKSKRLGWTEADIFASSDYRNGLWHLLVADPNTQKSLGAEANKHVFALSLPSHHRHGVHLPSRTGSRTHRARNFHVNSWGGTPSLAVTCTCLLRWVMGCGFVVDSGQRRA